jgi:hypothetical protein
MAVATAGSGESGKSTIFKQMIHLYGAGFSQVGSSGPGGGACSADCARSLRQTDLNEYRGIIYENLVMSMKAGAARGDGRGSALTAGAQGLCDLIDKLDPALNCQVTDPTTLASKAVLQASGGAGGARAAP